MEVEDIRCQLLKYDDTMDMNQLPPSNSLGTSAIHVYTGQENKKKVWKKDENEIRPRIRTKQ